MQRVLANAIVDVIQEPTHFTMGKFEIKVWGKEPYDYVRHYEISAKTDTVAAQEGLRRFVEEMEQLDPAKD